MDNVKPCWKSWINLIKENLALGEIRLHAHRVQDTSKGKTACDNGFLRSQDTPGHLTHPVANHSERGGLPGEGLPFPSPRSQLSWCCITTIISGSEAFVPLLWASWLKSMG